MFPVYAVLIPYVAAMLAHLAGLAVAIFLLIRSKGKAAILAALGFALLILINIGQIVLALPPVSGWLFSVGPWLIWALYCCCSILDMVAIACLIIAIWQAVLGTDTGDVAQEAAYTTEFSEKEVVVNAFEEAPEEAESVTGKLEDAPEETPYVTRVLDETLEGEILEDTPVESPSVTQVLPETQEEAAEESE
jgi:hypothetical protein